MLKEQDFIYDPSLVLYLPLYLLDGDKFQDKSAYGHLATVTGATWGIQGRTFGGADYISLPSAVYQAFASTSDFTVLVWARITDTATVDTILFLGGASSPYRPYIIIQKQANETVITNVCQTASATINGVTSAILAVGFHLIGLTHDASESNKVSQFIDGEAGGTNNTNALTFAKADFGAGYLGIVSPTGLVNPFYSILGEVLVYNRVLTAQEIQRHYLATKGRYR